MPRLLLIAALTYALVVVMFTALESRLVFFPMPASEQWTDPPDPKVVDVTATLPGDGWALHGWWLPPKAADAGAVLVAHGNGGNIVHRAHLMMDLHRSLGAGVLLFDYPGYGKSEGRPDEARCYATADAFYAKLTTALGVPANRVILLGESLGGGVAADQAARLDHRALVLVKTFTSLPAVAKGLYPFLPTHTFMRTRFDTASKLPRCPRPVFIAHGTADTLVRPAQADGLFAAAREPKGLFWMEGQEHNALLPAEFYDRLRAFLAAHAP